MQTGENEQGLREILDFTRLVSITVLSIGIYQQHYAFFDHSGLSSTITDRLLTRLTSLPVFHSFLAVRLFSLLLLAISLLGSKGKKDEQARLATAFQLCAGGLVCFFAMDIPGVSLLLPPNSYTLEIGLIVTGYLIVLAGGTRVSRILWLRLNADVFNTINETFPQEERLLVNEYSINLPARYMLKNKCRRSWINIINPFRGNLVIGTPGAGKSYFVIRHIITQHISKGFTMFLYDFKYDDLSRIAYNHLLKNSGAYDRCPAFYTINFDDLRRSHRCNPLEPQTMTDITDATEASRTIMLGLNREWIKKQGDFFVESPINFVTAIIWFLKKYQNGKYCTLPHVIELMQIEYKQLFPVLMSEPEIEVLVNPFMSAFQNEAMEQLEGQVASAKISMARLSSPQLYYVLSGNDFTLDVNNPQHPKIVSMGNNPQKQQVYGAVLSLYISRAIKLANRKGQAKCSLIFDEFPTIYFNGIDSLIATARSNRVATTLAVQDYSQLKKDYGREQADVIMNIVGNVISGQAAGETAKQLSERFGRINQERTSVSINSNDTSISRSTHLDNAVQPATIASLSSGSFVGIVADNPDQKIELKAFHAEIVNDHGAIKEEEHRYCDIPAVRSFLNPVTVTNNYNQIKADVKNLIALELDRLSNPSDKLDSFAPWPANSKSDLRSADKVKGQ